MELIEEDFDTNVFPSVNDFIAGWYGITATKFDPSKAIQPELEKFKLKYAGKKPELKQPVIRVTDFKQGLT